MRAGRRPSYRPERVGELIREALAEFLTSQVQDPRIGFVTVTGVEVSPDLAHARVRVSVMAPEAERERTLAGLASAAGFLRSRVTAALALRTSPELRFELDRGLDHAHRIDVVLKGLKGEGPA